MLWFWALVLPALALAVYSLRDDRRAAAYVAREMVARPAEGAPSATVVVPIKGWDEGIGDNLAALADLDYPDYELIVCARSGADIPAGVVPPRARIVVAGPGDENTGEKIRNLLAAVEVARPDSRVFAFADSDGTVRRRWLKALVAGLEKPGVGAATGYRLYVPSRTTVWNLLRSVWNGVIAGLFGEGAPFAWGGAMAVRREVFDACHVPEFWRGHVSDDLRLTAAVKASGLRIVFAPAAMVACVDSTTGIELLAWMRRQLTLSRVYAPRLWWPAFLATLLYCGAAVACVVAAARGAVWALGLLVVQLGLGMWKGHRRGAVFRSLLPEHAAWFDRYGWVNTWLVPAGTWLWLYAFAASAWNNVISWRGNLYRLHPGGVRRV